MRKTVKILSVVKAIQMFQDGPLQTKKIVLLKKQIWRAHVLTTSLCVSGFFEIERIMENLTTPYAIPCVISWFIAHDQTRSTKEEQPI
jgi:hypothetical protein